MPDFSYAGYYNGEKTIDYSAKNLPTFYVTDYGAIADDNISDKPAVRNAINAVIATGKGAIIFFPPGRFILQDATDDGIPLEILRRNDIILKGSGSGPGGTELFMKAFTPLLIQLFCTLARLCLALVV